MNILPHRRPSGNSSGMVTADRATARFSRRVVAPSFQLCITWVPPRDASDGTPCAGAGGAVKNNKESRWPDRLN